MMEQFDVFHKYIHTPLENKNLLSKVFKLKRYSSSTLNVSKLQTISEDIFGSLSTIWSLLVFQVYERKKKYTYSYL